MQNMLSNTMSDELSELIDTPVERLHVEYKSWIDLADPKTRASLARHIAAIANSGGGHIVFGIADDNRSCGHCPADYKIDHDTIAAVTKRYLDPSIHCDVRWISSSTGVLHPIVIVPSHGATPICAKANGPEVKGKIEGIVAGAYYLRKPGPESVQIVASADWHEVIRRCALHDRTAILSAIAAALADGTGGEPDASRAGELERWVSLADLEYLRLIEEGNLEPLLRDCRIQLSYAIETSSPEELPASHFVDLIRQVGYDVDRHVQSGWSLFFVFNNDAQAPRWVPDPIYSDQDILQSSLLGTPRTLGFDLWRVSRTGLATHIREYWEDTPDFGLEPRTSLNPEILLRMLGELVRHAQALSGRFNEPLRIQFRCEWRGLKGRRLAGVGGFPFRGRPAQTDRVVTLATLPASASEADFAEAVYGLAARVARILDWEDFSPAVVTAQMPGWKRL